MKEKVKGEARLIEIRRARIMELLSNGYASQVKISEIVNVSEPTVSRDIRFLKDKARKELEIHFQERLPFEYARAMAGINATLARVAILLEESKDPKTKIECMKLQMDLWKSVMSMATDGGIIERAIKVIKGMESKEQSQAKKAIEAGEKSASQEPATDNSETEEDLKEE
jgi:DNA-binding Lrp family transcriptional regulator